MFDLCSREYYIRLPPHPIFAQSILQGGGGGYILKSSAAGSSYTPPLFCPPPPPLEGSFQGWGGVYKIWPCMCDFALFKRGWAVQIRVALELADEQTRQTPNAGAGTCGMWGHREEAQRPLHAGGSTVCATRTWRKHSLLSGTEKGTQTQTLESGYFPFG